MVAAAAERWVCTIPSPVAVEAHSPRLASRLCFLGFRLEFWLLGLGAPDYQYPSKGL